MNITHLSVLKAFCLRDIAGKLLHSCQTSVGEWERRCGGTECKREWVRKACVYVCVCVCTTWWSGWFLDAFCQHHTAVWNCLCVLTAVVCWVIMGDVHFSALSPRKKYVYTPKMFSPNCILKLIFNSELIVFPGNILRESKSWEMVGVNGWHGKQSTCRNSSGFWQLCFFAFLPRVIMKLKLPPAASSLD